MVVRQLLVLIAAGTAAAEDEPEQPQIILNDNREHPAIGDSKEGAGKFQDLLNWAISNSDPEELKKQAADHPDGENVIAKMGQQAYDALFGDNVKKSAREAAEAEAPAENINLLDVVKNKESKDDDVVKALEMLEDMVTEPDMSMGLYKSGALGSIADLVTAKRIPDITLNAAWILGTACQNIEDVQLDLMSLDMAARGLDQLKEKEPQGCGFAEDQTAGDFAVCNKLIYFFGAFVRNNRLVQIEAQERGVFTHMLEIFETHPDAKVVRKTAAFLETVAAQDATLEFVGRRSWNREFWIKAAQRVEAAIAKHDMDTTEKIFELCATLSRTRKREQGEKDVFLSLLDAAREKGQEKCGEETDADKKVGCERLDGLWERLQLAFKEMGEKEKEEQPALLLDGKGTDRAEL